MEIKSILKATWVYKQYEILKLKSRFKRKDGKLYCVIWPSNNFMGPFSAVFCLLEKIKWLDENGVIPVIDLKQYPEVCMQDIEYYSRENAWTYYFKQPVEEIDLDALDEEYTYTMGNNWNRQIVLYPQYEDVFLYKGKKYSEIKSLFKKYIHFSDRVLYIANNNTIINKINDGRVLGVSIRAEFAYGKELGESLYLGHPIVNSIDYYVAEIEDRLRRWKCDYAFIQVDDLKWKNEICNKLKDKCIFIERPLMRLYNDDLSPITDFKNSNRFTGIRKRNEEYIAECILLSKCSCFIGTKGLGCAAIYYMKDVEFEHVEFWEHGRI